VQFGVFFKHQCAAVLLEGLLVLLLLTVTLAAPY